MNDKVLKASDIKQRFPDGSIETVWGDYYRINKQGQLELALVSLPEFTVRSAKPKAELSTWTSSDLRNSDKIKKERRAHLIVQEQKDARDLAGKTMLYGLSMIPVTKGALITYKAVSPFVKKLFSNPYVQTAFTVDGARNLFTDNGVLKTYRHFRDGEYGKGALSLTGDILDATGVYGLAGTGKRYAVDATRRAVETAMRTTRELNPLPTVVQNFNILKSSNEGRKRLKTIGKYIFTGKSTGKKGYYNSLASSDSNGVPLYYSGFYFPPTKGFGILQRRKERNDIIDAYLYGKEIDPEFGLKRINSKDYGLHTDYINKWYPNRDISIYEMEKPNIEPLMFSNVPSFPNNPKILIGNSPKSLNEMFENYRNLFYDDFGNNDLLNFPNVAGHRAEYGITNLNKDSPLLVSRGQDIWKFNPSDYMQRWINTSDLTLAPWMKYILKFGLKTVNNVGTPIIFRTPWMKENRLPSQVLNTEGSIIYGNKDLKKLDELINPNLK